MRSIQKDNENYAYILTIIDVFSKKPWAIKLKNKKAETVLNKDCKKYLKNSGINLNYTNSEMKASVIERFNRTLKEKMWRYFTFSKNKKYIDILDDLVYSYNNTYHRSIKTTPNKVNSKNESQIYINLYGLSKNYKNKIHFKFKIGDYVRLSKTKRQFEKGYTNNWTKEIFLVHKLIIDEQPTYIIKDLNNEILLSKFYEKELQQVYITDDKTWEIYQIIKTRIVNKKKEYFVGRIILKVVIVGLKRKICNNELHYYIA